MGCWPGNEWAAQKEGLLGLRSHYCRFLMEVTGRNRSSLPKALREDDDGIVLVIKICVCPSVLLLWHILSQIEHLDLRRTSSIKYHVSRYASQMKCFIYACFTSPHVLLRSLVDSASSDSLGQSQKLAIFAECQNKRSSLYHDCVCHYDRSVTISGARCL